MNKSSVGARRSPRTHEGLRANVATKSAGPGRSLDKCNNALRLPVPGFSNTAKVSAHQPLPAQATAKKITGMLTQPAVRLAQRPEGPATLSWAHRRLARPRVSGQGERPTHTVTTPCAEDRCGKRSRSKTGGHLMQATPTPVHPDRRNAVGNSQQARLPRWWQTFLSRNPRLGNGGMLRVRRALAIPVEEHENYPAQEQAGSPLEAGPTKRTLEPRGPLQPDTACGAWLGPRVGRAPCALVCRCGRGPTLEVRVLANRACS